VEDDVMLEVDHEAGIILTGDRRLANGGLLRRRRTKVRLHAGHIRTAIRPEVHGVAGEIDPIQDQIVGSRSGSDRQQATCDEFLEQGSLPWREMEYIIARRLEKRNVGWFERCVIVPAKRR
jgi:hypothetical protein